MTRVGRHYTKRLLEHTTDIVATTFADSHCRHVRWYSHGLSENGKQRWICAACGKQRRDGAWDDAMTRIRVLATMFQAGVNRTEAARRSGYTRETVRNYYRKFEKLAQPPLCPCGRSSLHSGWCAARLAQRAHTDFIKLNLSMRWKRMVDNHGANPAPKVPDRLTI